MHPVGSAERPLRVAVVGSGPAGFYTVQHLFQRSDLAVAVDMFDRLPTPFGLVRFGVAPDHPKIKSVVAVYDKLARDARFRFFGNVTFGGDLSIEDLARHYDQVVFATGAQTDRRLGIPGEELAGSHPATEFVAWYNGHPDYRECRFDLGCEAAVVVGVGNVAVDVARILSRHPDELARTDIADYALEALRASRVREVHLLGRRGPAQAAFTTPEARELGQIEGCATTVRPEEVRLDAVSRQQLELTPDRATARKLEVLEGMAARPAGPAPRRLTLRFLVSPTEIVGDARGRVRSVSLTHNELFADEGGAIRSRAIDRTESIEAGLVFRSVGYRGVALAGVPFDERRGVIPNAAGRVVDPDSGTPRRGLYVAGWIKRGPSGVIGTNKPDAGETVDAMAADVASGALLRPAAPAPDAVVRLLEQGGRNVVTYDDWKRLDAAEIERGTSQGRPRVKFTDLDEMLRALGRR